MGYTFSDLVQMRFVLLSERLLMLSNSKSKPKCWYASTLSFSLYTDLFPIFLLIVAKSITLFDTEKKKFYYSGRVNDVYKKYITPYY